MRRFSLWMRAHPTIGDVLVAGIVAMFDVVGVASFRHVPPVWVILAGLLLMGPLVVRRRYPVLVAYLVLAGGALQLLTHGGLVATEPELSGMIARGGDLALGVMLYTLVAYVGRREGARYAIWLGVGTAIWALWRLGGWDALFAVGPVVIFAFCWICGEWFGARRAYHSEVEQRLKLLETERDQQARIAVGQERARIARELHDVVAHAVSVMVVQADGAAYTVRSDPDLAEKAVRTISDTGREALSELRRLLGVLRSEDDSDQRAPQPSTSALPELVERVADIGLPVRLDTHGDLDHLPTGIGLGIYRIVQEALTNSLKHAGPGASAVVSVYRLDDRVELRVDDDGLGTPAGLLAVSGGNGLIGMRERASVFGGVLEAGPGSNGGWRVHAVLPVGDQA